MRACVGSVLVCCFLPPRTPRPLIVHQGDVALLHKNRGPGGPLRDQFAARVRPVAHTRTSPYAPRTASWAPPMCSHCRARPHCALQPTPSPKLTMAPKKTIGKKKLTGYMAYAQERRPTLKKEKPNLTFGEVRHHWPRPL